MAGRPRPIILPGEGNTVNDPLELARTLTSLREVKRKAEAEKAALALALEDRQRKIDQQERDNANEDIDRAVAAADRASKASQQSDLFRSLIKVAPQPDKQLGSIRGEEPQEQPSQYSLSDREPDPNDQFSLEPQPESAVPRSFIDSLSLLDRSGAPKFSIPQHPEVGGTPKERAAARAISKQGLDAETTKNLFGVLGKKDKTSEKAIETKIRVLKEQNPDLSEKVIVSIATGATTLNVDPVTGEKTLVNKLTGTAVPVTQTDNGFALNTNEDGVNPEDTLFAATEKGGGATGVWSAFLSGGSVLTGSFGGPAATETLDARQTLRTGQQDFVRALSLNPRFPVAEMEAIKKEINLSPKILDNKQLLQTRMRAVDRSLRTRLKGKMKTANNTRLPAQTRRDARQTADAIQNFLNVLGVPNRVYDMPDGTTATFDAFGKRIQ